MRRPARLAAVLLALVSPALAAAADPPLFPRGLSAIVADSLGHTAGAPGSVYVLAAGPLTAERIRIHDGDGRRLALPVRARRDERLGVWVHALALPAAAAGRHWTIAVDGGPSRRIAVEAEPYRPLLRALLRSFWLQRCGVAYDDAETGLAHEACHRNDAQRAQTDSDGPQGGDVPATGGWHDAGDYGKYVATTAAVTLELLTRFERFPEAFDGLALAIPESGDAVPDLLDEMAVGLDWMLAMQRRDGAVYRKVGGRAWPAGLDPDADRQPRLAYGVSSPETAKAAAAWMLAARVYRPHDAARADRYAAAADRAWAWLAATPAQQFDFRDGDDSGSGPYRANATDTESTLTHDRDDRLAAAIERWLATGDDDAARMIDRLLPGYEASLFEWKDVATLSLTSLLWHPRAAARDDWRRLAAATLEARAARALATAEGQSFSLANARLIWGSNKMVLQEGVLLAAADRQHGDPRARAAAWQQLHFVRGANPLAKTFVTGFGDDPVRQVSHLWLRRRPQVLPGLVVGGPNEREQSGIAPRDRGLLSYADDARSYATNEYAIDYSSALIALLVDLGHAGRAPYAGLGRVAPWPSIDASPTGSGAAAGAGPDAPRLPTRR